MSVGRGGERVEVGSEGVGEMVSEEEVGMRYSVTNYQNCLLQCVNNKLIIIDTHSNISTTK